MAVRETYLDEVFTLSFGHKWLELGRCECIDEPSFRDNKKEHLGACEDRELIGLEEEEKKK